MPGFKGGDRTSIDLPKPEEDLLEAVAATGKPLLVLTNGSALAVNWANEHANAILDAWYPGEEGGTAVAETLSGKNNPAGRLPVTFYKSVDQLASLRRLRNEGTHLSVLHRHAALSFRLRHELHEFSYSDLNVTNADCRCRRVRCQPMSLSPTAAAATATKLSSSI